jgi:small-conductance mechanosensitive channel
MGVRTHGQDRPALLTAATVLILMLAGYFGIYLITPHDLRWHLLTSLNRLFIQLWPSAVFLCFMVVRTPEQAVVRGVIRKVDQFLSRPDVPAGPKKQSNRKQKRRRTSLPRS